MNITSSGDYTICTPLFLIHESLSILKIKHSDKIVQGTSSTSTYEDAQILRFANLNFFASSTSTYEDARILRFANLNFFASSTSTYQDTQILRFFFSDLNQ